MKKFIFILFLVAIGIFFLVTASSPVFASNNLLLNGDFEKAANGVPDNWKVGAGHGDWIDGQAIGSSGKKIVRLQGKGSGHRVSWDYTGALDLEYGKTYRVQFSVRGDNNTGSSCIISGMSNLNNDFKISKQWQVFSFIFTPSMNMKDSFFRIGLWEPNGKIGTIYFDDVSLIEVQPLFKKAANMKLSRGESVDGDQYKFHHHVNKLKNYSPIIIENNTDFNGSRINFELGSSLIYKHKIGSAVQLDGKLVLKFSRGAKGTCIVSASKDGKLWQLIAKEKSPSKIDLRIPKKFYPTKDLYIKLTVADTGAKKSGHVFQMKNYTYTAKLSKKFKSMQGATYFYEQKTSDKLDIEVLDFGDGNLKTPVGAVTLKLTNKTDAPIKALIVISGEVVEKTEQYGKQPIVLAAGESQLARVDYNIKSTGQLTIKFDVLADGKVLASVIAATNLSQLYASDYGYWLDSTDAADLWWCEGTYKIYRERPIPAEATKKPITMFAARGEYEPLQIVIKPKQDLKGVKFSIVGDDKLVGSVKLFSEHYVYVFSATDEYGCEDWWPDALPAITGPVDIKAGQNYPIWLLVKVGDDISAGDHKLQLKIESVSLNKTLDINLHVWDFALPKTPSLQSTIGLSRGKLRRYHNVKEGSVEMAKVWDLYMQNFREHRISPQEFGNPMAPIITTVTNTPWEHGHLTKDDPRQGQYCVKAVDDAGDYAIAVKQKKRIQIHNDRTYLLNFSVKTAESGQQFRVEVRFYNHQDREVGKTRVTLGGPTTWRDLTKKLSPSRVSKNASFVRIYLYPVVGGSFKENLNTGVAWFDDIQLVDESTGKNLLTYGDFEYAKNKPDVSVDFTAFDKNLETFLNDYKFSIYRLFLDGIGHGTLCRRGSGYMGGYIQGSPEYEEIFGKYCKIIEQHLEEKGWLDNTLIYAYDEPNEHEYGYVKRAMENIAKASPKLAARTIVTESPAPGMYGTYNSIWCPMPSHYEADESNKRIAAGDELWWYICTIPKAPYVGYFTDRSAVDMRLWIWMMWEADIEGWLIWISNYWTSNKAYPGIAQNPWQDPMGYIDWSDLVAGEKQYWSNCDGRFIYPPNRRPDRDKSAFVTGPVDSIRWEILREGMEDYEYFYMLKGLIAKAKIAGADSSAIAEAESLLTIPSTIFTSLTNYSYDPLLMYRHRAKLAASIEQLQGLLK